MSKILLLTQNYAPRIGGGIRYKVSFVEHFRSQGHVVDVLCIGTSSNMEIEETSMGNVYRLPLTYRLGSTNYSNYYFRFFRRIHKDYDAYHFNFPSPQSDIMLLLNYTSLLNKSISVYYHADIVKEKFGSFLWNRIVTRTFLKRVDKILVSNPRMKDSQFLKMHEKKIDVVPFGISDRNPAGRISYVEGNKVNLLFVGRLSRYKGVDLLIKACSGLNIQLDIVGTGDLETELKRVAQKENCAVTFHGFVSDEQLFELYAKNQVFVLPSIDAGEAFGYVLIEAMMYGNALITTELGTGTSWVNKAHSTGLVCEPNSVSSLRTAIKTLISDPDCLSKHQSNSRKRFEAEFKLEVFLRKLTKAIKTE